MRVKRDGVKPSFSNRHRQLRLLRTLHHARRTSSSICFIIPEAASINRCFPPYGRTRDQGRVDDNTEGIVVASKAHPHGHAFQRIHGALRSADASLLAGSKGGQQGSPTHRHAPLTETAHNGAKHDADTIVIHR